MHSLPNQPIVFPPCNGLPRGVEQIAIIPVDENIVLPSDGYTPPNPDLTKHPQMKFRLTGCGLQEEVCTHQNPKLYETEKMVCLKSSMSTLTTTNAENGLLNLFVTPGEAAFSSSSLLSQSDLNSKDAGVMVSNPNNDEGGNCGALMIDIKDDGTSFGDYRNESQFIFVNGITIQVCTFYYKIVLMSFN